MKFFFIVLVSLLVFIVGLVGLSFFTPKEEAVNLRERKELKDRANVSTYTYIVAENTGQLIFLGHSIGYPIPYSTQFTNPEKAEYFDGHGYITRHSNSASAFLMPQANPDPNGLFSPASSEGTWVEMVDPATGKVSPLYVEPRVICSQYPLHPQDR